MIILYQIIVKISIFVKNFVMDFAGILIPLIMISISCFIIWKAANGFEIASDYLGRNLHEGIKGATINAVASSMPEFLATIFFLFYIRDVNGFSGGIGVTAGSAIYNLLIIPACVIIFGLIKNQNTKITIRKSISLRDGIFLIITTLVLIITLKYGSLNWFFGALMFFVYLLYLAYLYYTFKKTRNTTKSTNTIKYIKRKAKTNDLLKLNIQNIILGNKDINKSKAWYLLVASTFVMLIGTWILVQATEWLGADIYKIPYAGQFNGLDIPILFVALILAAAASSLPDTIISIKDAKKGNYDDAFSNAIGSNIFDISFALGVPLLIYTLIFGTIEMSPEIIQFSLGIWEVLLFLTVITVLIFIVGKHMTKTKAFIMMLLYLFFIIMIFGLIMGSSFATDFFNFISSII